MRRRRRRRSALPDASIRPRSQALESVRPRSEALALEKDPSGELNQHSPAHSGNMSELAAGDGNSAFIVSPQSTQGTWSRPTSAEVEGNMPTYQSMGSLQSAVVGNGSPVYKPYRKPDTPPIGVHEVSGENDGVQATNRRGRQVGSGFFEMPASVPGSTLQYHNS